MRKFEHIVSLTLFLGIFFTGNLAAQGCSDAGFCSAGSLQASSLMDSSNHSIVYLRLVYGLGEQGVNVIHIVPEVNWQITKRISFQFVAPFVFASGNLGNTNGAGDFLLSFTYRLCANSKIKWDITAGGKLATGKSDLKENGFYSLPMTYQTGLGTYDFILGTSIGIKNWNFAAGLQKVFSQNNENSFLHYPGSSEKELKYFESRNLERGNDVLLRAGFLIHLSRANITPGLLGIYRINKDRITDISNTEIELKGSDGLTLNITLAAGIPVGEKVSIFIEAGAPAVVRDVRADGLTRSFAASCAIRYSFKN